MDWYSYSTFLVSKMTQTATFLKCTVLYFMHFNCFSYLTVTFVTNLESQSTHKNREKDQLSHKETPRRFKPRTYLMWGDCAAPLCHPKHLRKQSLFNNPKPLAERGNIIMLDSSKNVVIFRFCWKHNGFVTISWRHNEFIMFPVKTGMLRQSKIRQFILFGYPVIWQ